MREIKEINQIDPNTKEKVKIKVAILEVVNEGNKANMSPIKFKAILEHSGETFTMATWLYDMLGELKAACSETNVFELEATGSLYKDTFLNIAVSKITKTEETTKQKTIRTVEGSDVIKQQLEQIIKKNIKNPKLKSILKKVFEKQEFFTKPAAKSVHHAYPGGLLQHTFEVVQIIMRLYPMYEKYVNIEMLITGAILHDIGKTQEYEDNADFTFAGGLTTHIPLGIAILSEICVGLKLKLDDPVIIQLIAIISAHHGKLEYGSPSTPATLEAILISFADNISSSMEGAICATLNLQEFTRTDPLRALDGGRIMKIDNGKLLQSNKREQ